MDRQAILQIALENVRRDGLHMAEVHRQYYAGVSKAWNLGIRFYEDVETDREKMLRLIHSPLIVRLSKTEVVWP